MTTFPGFPRLLKGAIIRRDQLNPLASVLVFQYNPDTMTRRLEPRAVSAEGDRGESLRPAGPPKETITLKVDWKRGRKGVAAEGGDRSEALRLKGPLMATIKLDAEIHARKGWKP